ncbi:1083_t:CDS:2 [Cetraspora pellucida]|uniref:1083_t:CDS:1 n=1 Tax=Cetraspora pellucida TaxID=1433469 RepID=A0A9N9C8K2_9GLOM|nr:1083_t:CDS:2 [Cetraspora pellucida]
MWELTSGCRPFYDREYNTHLALDICNGLRPNITEDTPQCWAILMQKCWHSNSSKRPTIDELYDEPHILSLNDSIYQIVNLSNLNLNHDKLSYEAGNALAEALRANPTLKCLDLSSKKLCNGAVQGIAEALDNNNTLTNLNLENNYLGDDAGMALAKALQLLDESKLCAGCYYSQTQLQNVSSGNQDIDDLIKATYHNQPKFRLEWIPFEDFTDIKQIGNGGFSEIYMATWTNGSIKSWSRIEKRYNRNNNQTVVLKVLKDSQDINSKFLKELQNIVKSQPNSYMRCIIQCYGVSQFPKTNDYIFVMSYMYNGSLNDYLSNNLKDVTWNMKCAFLRDIVTGIKWIHKSKIVHRDIHSGNILIGNLKSNGPDSNILIADLGFSRPAKDDEESSGYNIYGIMPYIAPEVLNKKQYSFSSDIYSLGMIMWELTSGYRPFYDRQYDSLLALDICNELRPIITEDTPHCWAILMQKCWHSDPLKRPTIDEIFDEVNSKYWNETQSFIEEAENKRQKLLNTGKLAVKYMHPHSKTHSQLLNLTIDSMILNLLQGSKSITLRPIDSFQSINSDSFNIIPEHFKNANSRNSTINIPLSKKHPIEFLLDENYYDEIKRRRLSDNDSRPYTLSLNDAIYQITNLSNLHLNHDKLCYEAGKALAEALCTNPNLKCLDLSLKKLCNGAGQEIAKALSNSNTLINLNLENNYLGDDAVMALAKALYKNNTLICLNLRNNRFDSKATKTLVEALCKNTTLTSLNLSKNKLDESGEKALATLCQNTALTNLDLNENSLGESGKEKHWLKLYAKIPGYNNLGKSVGKALAEALCKNTTLTNLYLRNNELGELRVKALAQKKQLNIIV